MFKFSRNAALAMAALCAAAPGASAAGPNWPSSIVGTWNGLSNQTPIVVTITAQAGTGKCQNITGTLQNVGGGTDSIQGYYCPTTGAVEFRRFSSAFSQAIQVYNGNLNQAHAGAPHLFMAGSFSQYVLAEGPLGQYSFSVFN
jgi:hypothetical protein